MTTYKDIDFQLTPILDSDNTDKIIDIRILNDFFDVNQSIKNLILSSPTERPFNSVGVGLFDYKFEKITEPDLILLAQKISSTLSVNETRINIISVTVQQSGPEKVTVDVSYSPKWDPSKTVTRSVTI